MRRQSLTPDCYRLDQAGVYTHSHEAQLCVWETRKGDGERLRVTNHRFDLQHGGQQCFGYFLGLGRRLHLAIAPQEQRVAEALA